MDSNKHQLVSLFHTDCVGPNKTVTAVIQFLVFFPTLTFSMSLCQLTGWHVALVTHTVAYCMPLFRLLLFWIAWGSKQKQLTPVYITCLVPFCSGQVFAPARPIEMHSQALAVTPHCAILNCISLAKLLIYLYIVLGFLALSLCIGLIVFLCLCMDCLFVIQWIYSFFEHNCNLSLPTSCATAHPLTTISFHLNFAGRKEFHYILP